MAHFTWSLKVKASAAAAALFVVGLTIAGGLSYVAMNSATDNAHENRTSSAVKEGLEALKEVGTRMGVYASMLARHPDVVAAVKGNDTANLENVFVREFKALHASPRDIGGRNTQALCLFVDDADAHCAHARAHGATIYSEPATHDYGDDYWSDRSYGASDLEGHTWWFMHRLRDKPAAT